MAMKQPRKRRGDVAKSASNKRLKRDAAISYFKGKRPDVDGFLTFIKSLRQFFEHDAWLDFDTYRSTLRQLTSELDEKKVEDDFLKFSSICFSAHPVVSGTKVQRSD
eukprot:Gregarina_sp_Poly_1__8502@NODE_500_length_7882_cov_255_800640_g400_i0_p5_GENE_NODE_500_length_7882_cov_255_800640_g400_i0NODE_500_length_7882_cov_255_800640_g400_i0_p5_ORF_typecomplete_len107_score23_20DUF3450/PF11932_8/0_0041_NODE_500_length_7882_cov_255_800640_g400_i045174837